METKMKSPSEKTIKDMVPDYTIYHQNQNPATLKNNLQVLERLAGEDLPVSKLTDDAIHAIANRHGAASPNKHEQARVRSILVKMRKVYGAMYLNIPYAPIVKKKKEPEPEFNIDDVLPLNVDTQEPGAVSIDDIKDTHRSIVRTYNQLFEIRNNPNDELYKLLFAHLKRLVEREAKQLGA